eukprot:CAMPEP_0196768250 /NCGR_PEP_ID=MMETSP1095-20130614/42520_1 /TAXON_ID=96789 ORGANISM="Chromulina nebulosa, Strain UTEXLB2642" /NCGR_SAMPLE_ID=MMETSP1095 /ASSEMBLY_ACC=CAM_ASM_000446 /LENGTH=149 /DNA_ID=CAMNT_0042137559 /DNA_START=1422 /DNA_END=1871 /DNA_ORIENTATION=-
MSIAVIVSIASSFRISKIFSNVNKAASVAVISGLIAVSPAHADIIFAAPIATLVLADLGNVAANYPSGSYLTYDCPGSGAKSTVVVTTESPTKVLTTPVLCITDSVEVIQKVGKGGDFITDASRYGGKFSIDYQPGLTVVVSAQQSYVK